MFSKGSIFLFYLLLQLSSLEDLPPKNYALKFPPPPHSAYGRLRGKLFPNGTDAISVSMWVNVTEFSPYLKENSLSGSVLFSHDGVHREKSLVFESLHFDITDKSLLFVSSVVPQIFRSTFRLKEWNHYVLSWHLRNDNYKIYQNGKQIASQKPYSGKDFNFLGNNSFYIGHLQSLRTGEPITPESGFHGEITAVNMWDKALSPEEVIQVYESKLEGNTVAWSKTLWELGGGIRIIDTSVGIPKIQESVQCETISKTTEQNATGSSVSLNIRISQQFSG